MFNDNKDVLTAIKKQEESHIKMALEMGRVGNALVNIEKMLSKSLTQYTAENFVIQTYPQTFAANGYLYNSIFVGDSAVSDNAKLIIGGAVPTYTITLAPGENSVNIPDGATYQVSTTSGNAVTSLLTRYNVPSIDNNVSLLAGNNNIGQVTVANATTGLQPMNGDGTNATQTSLFVGAFTQLYNGSGHWNRAKDATGIPDNYSGVGLLGTAQSLWNGSTYDMIRNNAQGTLFASSARTSNVATPLQTNYNARGVIVYVNVTAASGTGGLTTHIGIQDSVSGAQTWLNVSPTAVTATGLYTYVLYPGISGGGTTQVTNAVLPRQWYVQVNTGDATSYTYSVGYSYIL